LGNGGHLQVDPKWQSQGSSNLLDRPVDLQNYRSIMNQNPPPRPGHSEMLKACEELGTFIEEGKIGDIVANHQRLILHYYEDVQEHVSKSFNAAIGVAKIGFWVLIATLAYALIFDGLSRFDIGSTSHTSFTVAKFGIVSGALIEFIAGVSFWLYARVSNQFTAFHICLERTHRYLLAYKITEQIQDHKDETVRDLVCIMANAPMITRRDIDAVDTRRNPPKTNHAKGGSSDGARMRKGDV
jgi:hypothetical protein